MTRPEEKLRWNPAKMFIMSSDCSPKLTWWERQKPVLKRTNHQGTQNKLSPSESLQFPLSKRWQSYSLVLDGTVLADTFVPAASVQPYISASQSMWIKPVLPKGAAPHCYKVNIKFSFHSFQGELTGTINQSFHIFRQLTLPPPLLLCPLLFLILPHHQEISLFSPNWFR